MAKQAKNTGRNWYVIHTYSGYEDAVREALLQRIESMNMQDKIFDVIVPKETQIVVKKGKPKTEKKRLFPGYVLVDMTVDDESWYVVRNTPNVTGFVGSGTIPVPVSGEEFGVIQRYLEDDNAPKFKITLSKTDLVMVLDGPFAGYEGVVNEIDEEKGKVKVMISIFGRETPVELDFDQVKKK
ncbi:MAG: transcription termination/antitermination protein NusG [Patescibacteria group bacterium]|jgi:transcriptional antiterminator NusG